MTSVGLKHVPKYVSKYCVELGAYILRGPLTMQQTDNSSDNHSREGIAYLSG